MLFISVNSKIHTASILYPRYAFVVKYHKTHASLKLVLYSFVE